MFCQIKKKFIRYKFEAVGEINSLDKFFLSLNKDVKCWGQQRDLNKFIKVLFAG